MAEWKKPLLIGVGWGLGTAVGLAILAGGFLWYESRSKPTVTSLASSTGSSSISVPRGITGLEVGMTPQQIGQFFLIKEAQDPVVTLLKRYGKPDQAEVVSRQNEAIQKRYFSVSSGAGKLPDTVTSADARATHNIVYQIGLHYDEAIVKRLGWEGVTYPYVAKFGKPSEDTGSAYVWKDGRTRLEIVSSGSVINVFFTDEALEIETKKEERKNH